MKVLINAYACAPNRGSEPGMAWNWIINLANYCELYIITEGEWKEEIERELSILPFREKIHFYYNPVSERIRKICWNQGDWRFYIYYSNWQKKTLKIAESIVKEQRIDIVHHLNMIGFREPGYLWKIDKPFIWGPIGGLNFIPLEYMGSLGIKDTLLYTLKNAINYLQTKTHPRVLKAVKKASFLISASQNSILAFQQLFKRDSVLINETGCYIDLNKPKINSLKSSGLFKILWVGRFIPTKYLGMALQSIAEIKHLEGIEFHIVGDGIGKKNTDYWKKYAEKLGIQSICFWHGLIPHNHVQILMKESDLFLFTSIAEGTPHVVLESIANNLPILCFNTCGQGDVVNEKVGYKIEMTNPKKSISEFASKIKLLYNDRELLNALSENCNVRQRELTWELKAIQMVKLYKKAIEDYPQN